MTISECSAVSDSNESESDSRESEALRLNDAELLAEYTVCRDTTAFSTLVNRHYGMVLGVAKRMLGCSHAAEDVAQATFIVLANKARQIRKRDSLASWLYGVAFRISARTARQRARSTVSILEEDVMVSADPLEKLTAQCEQNSVLEELYRLPEKVRTCMVLRYLQGKSNSQVAEEMSLSESAVEGRLKRGRNQLRLRLAKQGVGFVAAVTLLETMRQDAVAMSVPESVCHAMLQSLSGAKATSVNGTGNQAKQLAEQELSKMLTSKMLSNAMVAALVVGVASMGWGLVGGAMANAQAGEGSAGATTDLIVQTPKPEAAPSTSNPFSIAATTSPTSATLKNANTISNDVTASNQPAGRYFSMDQPTEREQQFLEFLRKSTDVEFDGTLVDFTHFIKSAYDIPLMLDQPALEDIGLDSSSDLITVDLKKLPLGNALDLSFEQIGLETIRYKGVLLITTPERIDDMIVTHVYRRPSSWSITDAELVEAIRASVNPQSWGDNTSTGSITSVGQGIVIRNSRRVHEQVNQLFAKLEKLYSSDPGSE